MESSALNRYATGILPLTVLSVLLLATLLMMNAATQNSALFGNVYSLLLIINITGVVLLIGLIVLNVHNLLQQFRARVMGSRLTLRLLIMLSTLTLVPVVIVFVFSLHALNRGIDSWFDVKIEQAMDDALILGRTAFDAMKQELVKTSQDMAVELEGTSDRLALTTLGYLREQHTISELTLFTQDGLIIASSSQEGPEAQSLLPARPGKAILSQIRQGLTYANLDPVGESELQLRVVVPVYSQNVGAPMRILQVLKHLPPRFTKLGESVQSAFAEYEKLLYLRGPLKFGFTLTLSLVALLALLIAISGAIFGARKLMAPIRDLAEGTAAVAQGDYSKQLPVSSRDEFGILVDSFNTMTREINRAQNDLKHSQAETELQRTYLETVLGHLSSGVLSLDANSQLRTHNIVVEQILGTHLSSIENQPITALTDRKAELSTFVDAIVGHIEKNQNEWLEEITLSRRSGIRTLILRGTRIPGSGKEGEGYVIVVDDVTALIQAQREAAWGEVARRLAHEIKNPLTPIQLSAERLRHKLLNQLTDSERDVLDRSTRTIVDQVEALKTMVNAFSDYARPSQVHAKSINLNTLIQDVVELYKSSSRIKSLTTTLDLGDAMPAIMLDSGRIRQVLHNLLRNAVDATQDTPTPKLSISTRMVKILENDFIELKVEDNGPGFPAELMGRLFDPYVTGKEKGTGLGLAIVKKIVDEHHGTIWAENMQSGGARIIIRLPVDGPKVATTETDVHDDMRNQEQGT
ncbi:MAG: ATP-binding protein [Gammaproteobacteria bacterium]|nr:MAG: ATP-binding protein [Gammaproteobacteria bacterium]